MGMTAFDDLSPYSYLPDSIPPGGAMLNVGWLDVGRDYPVGSTPEGFLEKLGILCADHPQARTRGRHSCRLPHPSAPPPYPITIEAGGRSVTLGGAEVRVVDCGGTWLAAPDLIHHYVAAHRYRPPDAFIEGVIGAERARRL
ncbi:hypothetical protein GCM10009802_01050 [Streptomyces synnematoformans]|uniref:DUF7919 domain-containing protein n=2 Tax=Streptomyces synnematoformans TaxID=415721 RepID=A0ABN2X7B4_9ACTN